MAIETGFPCIPIFKESEGGGGCLFRGGGSCLTILPMGWVLIQGGCLFVKGTYKGMCMCIEEYNI